MKNKKLFFRIYLIFLIILFISIVILAFLGNRKRIGYLSEFKINIDKTLELNGLNTYKIKQLFTIDNILNETSINNFIFTNTSITNYSYDFRIKYYSKVFRNSDIYGVYPNLNNLPEYIKSSKIDDDTGTPFGYLISTKELKYDDKIDNIDYILKLKYNIILIYIAILLIYICLIYRHNIYNFFKNLIVMRNKKLISKICFIIISIIIVSIIVLAFLGKKDRLGYLSEFKINTYHTLELNGLNTNETKQLFTVDNMLDETSINNFIFTNTSITNYSYDFRIKYYSKVFRNSDIYGVYPILNNLPQYIKSIKMYDNTGTPFGYLTSAKELKYDDKIDTQYYLMLNFNIFYYIAIIFIISLLCIGFYLLKEYWKYKKTLDIKDYLFINKIELITIILIIFKIWLFYPGYYWNYDTVYSIILILTGFNSANWMPILTELNVKLMDKLGLTMGIFFIINTMLLYCSIFLIIISSYIKNKNKFVILLFLITFLAQIFFSSIEYLKDSVATLYVLFSYSIVFSIIVLQIKNINVRRFLKIISLISLIIGMLHRHNFIVTVYPILIWFTYDYLKTKNINDIKKYIISFCLIMLFNAIVLMSIFFIFPRIFIKDISNPTRGLYLLQIAGAIVPANDSSIIPDDWYADSKNFNDVVEQYNKDPLLADPLGVILSNSKDVKKIWIKSILKYPSNYIRHMWNFTTSILTLKYEIINSYVLTLREWYEPPLTNPTFELLNITIDDVKKLKFYDENMGIYFTELKFKVFYLLNKILPNINVFLFVLLSIILFFASGLLFIFNKKFRNDILVFVFSTSFSAFATAFIVSIFSPVVHIYQYRYIYPVIPISIVSLIGFIIFIYDRGGFKKFIKELRGKN